jgi:glycosyltransferase involved in cell wall biosynthesis
MKIAIVHDWLVVYGGAERVLENIIDCFPEADLFSLVDFLEERDCLRGKPVHTSFLQRLPGAKKHYRNYLPLMPLAIEQFDLSAYDLVISSSYAVAKGVLTGPDQMHISYMHSPIRYAWDLQHQYLRESGLARGAKSVMARWLLHYIRNWDARSTNGVDHLIANSSFIRRRIAKVYRRDATVIHPPVALDRFQSGARSGPQPEEAANNRRDSFYLTASRMVPYKRIDLVVRAFSQTPERRLVVIGDGPDMAKIAALATSNIQLLGYQSFDVLHDHLRRATAFVFAAEEDFGISVVEAQACGTPVIAFGRGGALDSVVPYGALHPTGLFFEAQTVPALLEAVTHFEALQAQTHGKAFSSGACRRNAERFSETRFKREFRDYVEQRLEGRRGITPVRYAAALEQATDGDDALHLVG